MLKKAVVEEHEDKERDGSSIPGLQYCLRKPFHTTTSYFLFHFSSFHCSREQEVGDNQVKICN